MEDEAFEFIADVKNAIRKHYLRDEPQEPMPYWIANIYVEADKILETHDAMNGWPTNE